MLLGLSNAPVSFQGYINKIVAKNIDILIIIYLNNILIYIKDSSQLYVKIVYLVFDQI